MRMYITHNKEYLLGVSTMLDTTGGPWRIMSIMTSARINCSIIELAALVSNCEIPTVENGIYVRGIIRVRP
jgi:hypothetical protein